MPLPRIIGFCGQAGAGKTTAACFVVAASADFVRLSFADPLRAMLFGLGLTSADLSAGKHDPHPLLCGQTPRFAMQTLGTEWGREKIGDNIWLKAAERRALTRLAEGHRVVFDDVRFDNEATMIRSLGGFVCRLVRPELGAPMLHASERGVSPPLVDLTIEAAGVASLQRQLHAWANVGTLV